MANKYAQKAIELLNQYEFPNLSYKFFNDLGLFYLQMTNYEKAIYCYEKGLELGIKKFGKTSIQNKNYYHYLGLAYTANQIYHKATNCYKQYFEINKLIFKPDSPDMLQSYFHLANNYLIIGSYNICENLINDALKIINKYNIKNILSFNLYISLAAIYNNKGRYNLENDTYKKASEIIPYINNKLFEAFLYIGIANMYICKNEYSKCKENINKSLEIIGKLNSNNNPTVHLNTYLGFASLYNKIGLYDKEIIFCEKANKLLTDEFQNKLSLSLFYERYAEALINQKKYEEAEKYLKKGIDLLTTSFNEDYSYLAVFYNILAKKYKLTNQNDLSIYYSKKAISLTLKIFDKNHPLIGDAYDNIGNVEVSQNKMVLAKISLDKALEIRLYNKEENKINIGYSYKSFGRYFISTKEYIKGLEFYKKAFAIIHPILGDIHPVVKSIKNKLFEIKKKLSIDDTDKRKFPLN